MKLLFSAFLLCLFACPLVVMADQPELSPNKQWEVSVDQDSKGVTSYKVINTSNKNQAFFPSSYQPISNVETKEEAKDDSESAEFYWSPDSTYLMIDEFTRRGSGRLILIDLRSGAPLVIKLNLDDMIKLSGLPWHKWVVKVENGWTSPNSLSMEVGGEIPAVTEAGPVLRQTSLPMSIEFASDGKISFKKSN